MLFIERYCFVLFFILLFMAVIDVFVKKLLIFFYLLNGWFFNMFFVLDLFKCGLNIVISNFVFFGVIVLMFNC